jgi:hypothetical protein
MFYFSGILNWDTFSLVPPSLINDNLNMCSSIKFLMLSIVVLSVWRPNQISPNGHVSSWNWRCPQIIKSLFF